MYRTVANDGVTPEFVGKFDMLVFFSPAGVHSLLSNCPEFKQGNVQIAAFGTTTVQAIHDSGLRLDLEVPNEHAQSMTGAIDWFLEQQK